MAASEKSIEGLCSIFLRRENRTKGNTVHNGSLWVGNGTTVPLAANTGRYLGEKLPLSRLPMWNQRNPHGSVRLCVWCGSGSRKAGIFKKKQNFAFHFFF